MNRWSDPAAREIKRALSRYEKSQLPTTTGKALILPGEPPKDGEESEVSELIQAGFDPMYIFGVEHDVDTAEALYNYYFDGIHIHLGEAEDFLAKASGPFSYIHLDFCGQFKRAELSAVEAWMGKVSPSARLRVSVNVSRRSTGQLSFEQQLNHIIFGAFCQAAMDNDEPDQRGRWSWFRDNLCFDESYDTTRLLAGIMLFNFFFGMSVYRYADTCAEEGPYIPPVVMSHRLVNVRRYRYCENASGAHMATCWADVVPVSEQVINTGWTLNQVASVMESLVSMNPAPKFRPTFVS